MYVSLHFSFAPQFFLQKHGFSSVFSKRTSKNTEFFQIFGKRMQEAQASKKSRQGESSLGPLFCDSGSPKTTPPPPKPYIFDVGRGYPLSSSKYLTPNNVGGF